MPQNSSPRRVRTVSVLALTGLLALTACEDEVPQEQGSGEAGDFDDEGFDELEAPDPRGNQLSHEEMREILEDHFDGAGLSDTDDYYPNLRDIETELQKLAVDPTDCKQYVMQSASPVPEGALIAHADSGGAQNSGEGSESDSEDQADEGSQDEGGDTEASGGGFSSTSVTLPLENESEQDAGQDEAAQDDAPQQDGEDEGEDDEEDEPVEVDLPSERQATIYSFQDSRASEAYFAGEDSGLENCGSYTVTRGGIGEDDEPEAETSTSVESVAVESEAEEALGIYREVEGEDSTEQSVAVLLRHGSQVVLLAASAGEELDEEESEVAVEELEEQAHAILEDL